MTLIQSGNNRSSFDHSESHWTLTYYRQVSNIRRTLVGIEIVEHSDVIGASPVSAAPTTSSFSTQHLASMDWAKTTARRDEKQLSFGNWCVLYKIFYGNWPMYDPYMVIASTMINWYPSIILPTYFKTISNRIREFAMYRMNHHLTHLPLCK